MAKYNLLDDDDIFDEKEDVPADENELNGEPETSVQSDGMSDDIDINIDDDDMLDTEPSSSLDDQDFHTDLDITAIENENIDQPAPEPELEKQNSEPYEEYKPEIEEEEKQEYSDSPPFMTDDYEDSKQEGINYKPFVIAVFVIVVLVGVWFTIDIFVLNNEAEVAEEPVKTQEQLQQEKEAAEKATFLGQIAGKTSSDISIIREILGYGKNNAKVSSILLYNESLLFEVFGSSRDQVAKVNMSLKDNTSGITFEVIGSETRPGSKGGVFGLFKTEIRSSAASKNVSQASLSSVDDFQSWVQQTSNASDLNVSVLNNNYLEEEGYFRKFRVEATINGSIDACNNFLQKLSSENNQVKIHKLNLTAADQRNFLTKNYLLKLVLEVYV